MQENDEFAEAKDSTRGAEQATYATSDDDASDADDDGAAAAEAASGDEGGEPAKKTTKKAAKKAAARSVKRSKTTASKFNIFKHVECAPTPNIVSNDARWPLQCNSDGGGPETPEPGPGQPPTSPA